MDSEMKVRTTPRDFFLHLGVMVTLYLSAASLLTLLFQIINHAFPDALSQGYYYGYYNPYSDAVRWSIASLIVVFPLLSFLSRVIHRDYASVPEKRDIALRKWLVYLTLFVAGVTIMIDLIILINTFLGGEITMRFTLKVLSVLVVTGLVFGYYVYDLRHDVASSAKASKWFLGASALLIVASIVAGFAVMGSPSKQRDVEFDSRKVGDLQNVQWQIVNYWQKKGELPSALAEVQDPISGYMIPTDPQTGEPYQYERTGALSFKLCADFNYESDGKQYPYGGMMRGVAYDVSMPYPSGKADTWEHEEGVHCFERTIDPELYPRLDAYGRPLSAGIDQAQIDKMVEAKAALAASSSEPQRGVGESEPVKGPTSGPYYIQ